jgi:hypothetical protein
VTATAVVPRPIIIDCAVSNDPVSRTLTVKPAGPAGPSGLAFREAHRALLSAEQSGWRTNGGTVWASTETDTQVAFATADPDRALLKFHFPAGIAAYQSLVSRPGLSATASVDLRTNRFIGIKFIHKQP